MNFNKKDWATGLYNKYCNVSLISNKVPSYSHLNISRIGKPILAHSLLLSFTGSIKEKILSVSFLYFILPKTPIRNINKIVQPGPRAGFTIHPQKNAFTLPNSFPNLLCA